MRLIKVGLATPNPTVGAINTNVLKLIEQARDMEELDCDVMCFPEQAISGYPVEDLPLWQEFVSSQVKALSTFALRCFPDGGKPRVHILGITVPYESLLYNCVAVISGGVLVGIVPKIKLPTYGVFYEDRIFSRWIPGRSGTVSFPGPFQDVPFGDIIFEFPFGTMAVEVCEDIWSPTGPMGARCFSGAELVVNISASPWRAGVTQTRAEMISTRAADNQATIVYVNQYGGNDSLVFDGGGYVNQNGRMLLTAQRWQESISTVYVDLDRNTRARQANTTWRMDCRDFQQNVLTGRAPKVGVVKVTDAPSARGDAGLLKAPSNQNFFIPVEPIQRPVQFSYFTDLVAAMVTGLDYYKKTGAFKKIAIALSGGKDSALTVLVVYRFASTYLTPILMKDGESAYRQALKDFIVCYSMPSEFNTAETRSISQELCEELGITFIEYPIQGAFERESEAAQEMLQGQKLTPITKQNIQARIRGNRMQNVSNTSGAMWIQTGNMSEEAVGYMTMGGDRMGVLSLIGNLPKTVVIALLEHLNQQFRLKSIARLLATKASAELAPGQQDETDLMPYPILDMILYLFASEKYNPLQVYQFLQANWTQEQLQEICPGYIEGMLKDWVKKFVRLFFRSIFKWVQAPESIHLGGLHLDRERNFQLPTVQQQQWLDESLAELDAA